MVFRILRPTRKHTSIYNACKGNNDVRSSRFEVPPIIAPALGFVIFFIYFFSKTREDPDRRLNLNDRRNGLTDGCVNEPASEETNKRANDWINEWTNEQTNERQDERTGAGLAVSGSSNGHKKMIQSFKISLTFQSDVKGAISHISRCISSSISYCYWRIGQHLEPWLTIWQHTDHAYIVGECWRCPCDLLLKRVGLFWEGYGTALDWGRSHVWKRITVRYALKRLQGSLCNCSVPQLSKPVAVSRVWSD